MVLDTDELKEKEKKKKELTHLVMSALAFNAGECVVNVDGWWWATIQPQ